MPPANTIQEGSVVSIKPFGAFVQLDGFRKQGLVHISQLAPQRVDAVEDIVRMSDRVKVKVLPGDHEQPDKLALSMKQVDQKTGADLGDGGGRVARRSRDGDDESGNYTWGLQPLEHDEPCEAGGPSAPKEQANFEVTGKLAEATNKVNGVTLKWSEPHDAMKPSKHWRLYVFKGKEELEPYHIHRMSAYLLGRERRVCDIPLDHPSCSSQHAVLQFRLTQKIERGDDGESRVSKLVRPYLMDLGSTNGSFINGEQQEAQRYVELLHQDVLRFGYSSREYVLLNADG